MLPNDLILVYEVFRCAYYADGREGGEEFMEEYQGALTEAGKFLAFLGLAEPDAESPFDWRPTPDLMSLIARCATKVPKRKRFHEAGWILEKAFRVVYEDDEIEAVVIAIELFLERIGLVRGEGKINVELIVLIRDGCVRRDLALISKTVQN